MRYADRIGDFVTDEYFDGERTAARANLAALAKIDRSALSQTNQIAHDIFRLQEEEKIRDVTPQMMALTVVRPVNHFSGFHTFYPTFASGQGAAPFNTVEDYENNLSRHQDFITISDRSIERFREGMESGVVESQLTIVRVVEQLDIQLADSIEDSPYYRPVLNFPEDFRRKTKLA